MTDKGYSFPIVCSFNYTLFRCMSPCLMALLSETHSILKISNFFYIIPSEKEINTVINISRLSARCN